MGEEVEVEATDLQLVKIFHSKNKLAYDYSASFEASFVVHR